MEPGITSQSIGAAKRGEAGLANVEASYQHLQSAFFGVELLHGLEKRGTYLDNAGVPSNCAGGFIIQAIPITHRLSEMSGWVNIKLIARLCAEEDSAIYLDAREHRLTHIGDECAHALEHGH